MSNYYLHINTNRLSIELDSDVNYYHHFSEGDILTIKIIDGIVIIKLEYLIEEFVEHDSKFTLDWDKINSTKLTILECIEMGHITNITKSVARNKKIERLGI